MNEEENERKPSMSSKERAAANDLRNLERKQEREAAATALDLGNVDFKEIVKQGGSLGRRLEREIRRFEQTGRVSSWLAGETLKTEAAQNAAQQSSFKQAVLDVVKSSPSDAFDISPAHPSLKLITRKPEIPEEGAGAGIQNECYTLGLYIKNNNVWLSAGNVNGELISGLDPLDGKFIASSGSGVVYVEIDINQDSGEISASIGEGSSIPSSSDTKKYVGIGAFEISDSGTEISNLGCGSITVSLCRNWFVAEPPYFTVNISR